nr:surface lipoprotein assembly modifier [uncultured Haemophilus sp.]
MKFSPAFLIAIFGINLTAFAQAEVSPKENEPKVAQPRNDLTERFQVAQPKLNHTATPVQSEQAGKVTMTKEELAKHPDLIVRALIPAVLQNNGQAVELLLPMYKNLPKQDSFLREWAEAIEARMKGNYADSVARYRSLFAQKSNIPALRYQLAQALFLNNDNEAAKDQFEKLRAENLSGDSVEIIDQYLNALNKRDQWKFNGGMSFLNENNINNAPKAGTRIGGWEAWEKESAQGFSYYFNTEKKWSLPKRFFSKISLDASGKYYWNNKKYNELNVRAGVGFGYQTARFEIALTPFTEKRWYAGGSSGSDSLKQYSKNSGAQIEMSYWLNEKWQLSNVLEYGEQRYDWRKHLNGNNYLWSNTLLYVPKSGQYWFVGADYNRENARDKDNAYQRKNVRLGWGQEWGWGVSSRVSLSYAKRSYRAADLLQIRQKNDEYSTALTLWHRDLHFFGVTPKVTWQYQKVSSNHPFYSYDKNRVYLEMSKTF